MQPGGPSAQQMRSVVPSLLMCVLLVSRQRSPRHACALCFRVAGARAPERRPSHPSLTSHPTPVLSKGPLLGLEALSSARRIEGFAPLKSSAENGDLHWHPDTLLVCIACGDSVHDGTGED